MSVTDLSEDSLAGAARANLLSLLVSLVDLPGGIVGDGWRLWSTAVPHPYFTGVLSLRSVGATDAALVRTISSAG